jgi:hypothetical protein
MRGLALILMFFFLPSAYGLTLADFESLDMNNVFWRWGEVEQRWDVSTVDGTTITMKVGGDWVWDNPSQPGVCPWIQYLSFAKTAGGHGKIVFVEKDDFDCSLRNWHEGYIRLILDPPMTLSTPLISVRAKRGSSNAEPFKLTIELHDTGARVCTYTREITSTDWTTIQEGMGHFSCPDDFNKEDVVNVVVKARDSYEDRVAGVFDVVLDDIKVEQLPPPPLKYTVEVNVRQPNTMYPIAGAMVRVEEPITVKTVASGYTDSDGVVTFELEGGEYFFQAEAEGFHSAREKITINGDKEIYLWLESEEDSGGGKAEFWVYVYVSDRETNDRIQGAEVEVDGDLKGYTDDVGRLVFKLTEGTHRITVRKEGYYEWSDTVVIDFTKIIYPTLEPLPPPPTTYTLEFIVRDKNTGDFLKDVEVRVMDSATKETLKCYTDVSGKCVLYDVEGGEKDLLFFKTGYYPVEKYYVVEDDAVIHQSLEPEEYIPPSYTLEFHVKDIKTDIPLEGVEILLNYLTTGEEEICYTDTGGICVVELEEGEWYTRFKKEGYKTYEVTYIIKEDDIVPVSLSPLGEEKHVFKVIVEDDKGKPIQGAKVEYFNSGYHVRYTDASGVAEAEVAAGLWFVGVSKEGYEAYKSTGFNIYDDHVLFVVLEEYIPPTTSPPTTTLPPTSPPPTSPPPTGPPSDGWSDEEIKQNLRAWITIVFQLTMLALVLTLLRMIAR